MTPRMVANFRRSLSFPNHPSSSSSSSSSKPKKTFHVRSTSLPCRSHPLLFQLKDAINELKTWGSSRFELRDDDNYRTSSWLFDGLAQLKLVHESLDDLLQLPQTRESLFGHSELIEMFLEDFLHFVDIYGIFQTLVLSLKEEHLAAQVAVRRRDDSKMQLYLKSLKKMAKEMSKLVSSVQSMGKYSPSGPLSVSDGDAEVAGVIKDVIEVTVSVSIALFSGLSVSLSSRKSSRIGFCLTKNTKKVNTAEEGIQEFQQIGVENLWNLRNKGDEELKLTSKKMHEIEDCIGGIEIGSERAFRSLINTRVSFLNVLTQ